MLDGTMTRRSRRWIASGICAAGAMMLLRARASADTAGNLLQHRGFTIDVSAAARLSNYGEIERSLERQIDIVADCGVKPEIIEFFRAQRVKVVPDLQTEQAIPGLYDPAHGGVLLAALTSMSQPVLLHELLHGFHEQVVGPDNFWLRKFYSDARTYSLFDLGSHMMSDVKEFFAVSGCAYLHGLLDQEPFWRERIRRQQSNYYDWLGQLFGVEK
jgi:hypothetical protein